MKTLKNLITCLSLALISQGAFAQDSKIGVLNALQSLFNSDAARVWQQELDDEFSVDVNRGNELGTQLAQMQEEYQQNEAVMTEEEKTPGEHRCAGRTGATAIDSGAPSDVTTGKTTGISARYARRTSSGRNRCCRRG